MGRRRGRKGGRVDRCIDEGGWECVVEWRDY